MTKVMIVDDEILVRIGLRSTIHWEDFGFTVTADAANGIQAIEKFAGADPDILITDIRMPGMDGIELIKTLKKKKPQLKIIILTNYDNFEYAQQALAVGADDYLLKTTLDNQTIFPVLQKLQTLIHRETEHSLEYQELQQKALIGLAYLKKHFTESLLQGKISSDEWLKYLKELNLKWENNLFQLVLVKNKTIKENLPQTNQQPLQFVEQIVEKIHDALVWELPGTLGWVIIYNFPPEEESNYCKQVIPFNIRQVESCLKQYLQIATVAVLGKTLSDFQQLPGEWQSMCKLTEYCIFWPERELISYEDIPASGPPTFSSGFNEKNLSQFVKHGDLDKVRDSLAELFAKVNQSLSPVMLRQVWHELLVTIFRLVRENALCLAAILNDEEQDDAYFERFSSIPSMKDWFEQKFGVLIRQSHDQNVKNYSFTIRQAITFLEEHYREEINLKVLARQVGLSKNHLCTLFRIETGQNFIDYLHQIRISQAKGLLETTDLRVSEVGLNVGYHDAKYFAKVFQKYQNCSPSEYRQINH